MVGMVMIVMVDGGDGGWWSMAMMVDGDDGGWWGWW